MSMAILDKSITGALPAGTIITLKDVTDLLDVEHNKAMKKTEKLAEEPEFGGLAKTATPTFNPDGSVNKTIETYALTKRQAIAVGAKLNNALLMRLITKIEELEAQPKMKLPANYLEALEALVSSEKEKQLAISDNVELKAKITEDAPKVAFAESVSRTVDNLSVRDYAKVLYDENIKLGQNRLFHLLRMKGVLDRDNKPYQKYIDNGWFVLKLATYRNNSTDNVIEYTQPRITGKGQIALRTKIVQWLSGTDEAVGE